jgi:hypothetical protein
VPHTPKNDAPDRANEVVERSSALQQRPERGFSKARLEGWYREVWIKRNVQNEKIPNRAEDWQAAKFEMSRNAPRDAVRWLRREFAPESWTKGGRRKKTGGN